MTLDGIFKTAKRTSHTIHEVE
jgi:hypothetical protein